MHFQSIYQVSNIQQSFDAYFKFAYHLWTFNYASIQYISNKLNNKRIFNGKSLSQIFQWAMNIEHWTCTEATGINTSHKTTFDWKCFTLVIRYWWQREWEICILNSFNQTSWWFAHELWSLPFNVESHIELFHIRFRCNKLLIHSTNEDYKISSLIFKPIK